MEINNESPHFLFNVILSFFLFVCGHWINEIQLHVINTGLFHYFMSMCKAFSYIGAGLVGVVTFLKWMQSTYPKIKNYIKYLFKNKAK